MANPGFTYEAAAETPERVRDDLCRLWAQNLDLERTPEAKFAWLYREAPDPAETVFVLRAKDGDGGARVVGTNGVAVRRYQLGDREVRAGIISDLAVEREHRGLLPALRLVRLVRDFVVSGFGVAYGFPNTKAEGVMVRAGFRVLGKARRHARVLRHAGYASRLGEREGIPPIVVKAAANPVVAKVSGGIFDVARLMLDSGRVARAAKRHRFAWAERFDARFDDLWNAARREYDVIGMRTAAFLAWRYPDCEIATVVGRTDGTLRAYAVVERDPKTRAAHLRDVFGHGDALEPLFDLLVPALWLRGAASISVRFLGAPRVAELLRARGFEPRDEGRTVVVQIGDAEAVERARVEDASRWHLFDVDEDA